MEIRRMGEILLRSYSSHSHSFLAPSIPYQVNRAASTPSHHALASLLIIRRPFVTHRTLRQESSGRAAATPTSGPDDPNDSSSNYTPNFRATKYEPPVNKQQSLYRELANDLLDRTLKATPSQGSRPRRVSDTIPGGGSIASGTVSSLAAFNENYKNSPFSTKGRQGSIVDMMLPESGTETVRVKPRAVRTIKSKPSIGRTVEILGGKESKVRELGSALKVLSIMCRVNNVPKDKRVQGYHERPGLRRKRLKRERWRKRFREGFFTMLNQVKHMTKQGW